MNLVWLPSVLICLLSPGAQPSDPQEAARAIIRRAITAEGGARRLGQQVATHSRCKGKVLFLGNTDFVGETWTQKGTQVRQLLKIDAQGMRRVLLVLNGHDGWVSFDGRVEAMDGETQALVEIESYVDRVTNLVPLLREPQFHLSLLGDSTIAGRPVSEVKVASAGKPDVLLYFDNSSGLLTKREYRAAERGSDKLVTFVSLYSNYRILEPAESEEQTLHQAGVATDPPTLIEYLRARCLSDETLGQLRARIRELGARSFRQREKAQNALVAVGPAAVPFLRAARHDADPEIARRARECLRRIDKKTGRDPAVTTAVVRLIGFRKPAGGAATLLAFAPFAPDRATRREIHDALHRLARGSDDEAARIRKALDDPDPFRHAAATEALAQHRPAHRSHRVYLGGIRIPHHIETFRDKEPSMSYDTIGIEYFDHFEPSLFAKP